MALFFFRGICLLVMVFGFGMWGIRKLLRENPKTKDAIESGIVNRINRMFR